MLGVAFTIISYKHFVSLWSMKKNRLFVFKWCHSVKSIRSCSPDFSGFSKCRLPSPPPFLKLKTYIYKCIHSFFLFNIIFMLLTNNTKNHFYSKTRNHVLKCSFEIYKSNTFVLLGVNSWRNQRSGYSSQFDSDNFFNRVFRFN